MSTVSIIPGSLIVMDPSDKRVVVFDFDDLNMPAGIELTNGAPTFGITISSIKQNSITALTFDSAGLVTGNRKVSARFLATTASRGDKYRVSVKGTTNESPSQEKEYSIFVKIQDR